MDNSAGQLKRAQKIARMLATFSIVCLLSMIYAFIQKSESDRQAMKVQELSKELELCRRGMVMSDSTIVN
jgi:hypothetical protein